MNKFIKTFIASILLMGCIGINFSTANASENINIDETIDVIVDRTGLPYYVVENDIENIAKRSKQSKEVVAKLVLDEVKTLSVRNENRAVLYSASSGGGSGSKPLTNSVAGDIWYSDVSTLGWNHGHVGMYEKANIILEARGPGYKVSSRAVSKIKVGKGDKIMAVASKKNGKTRMSAKNRRLAISWARGKKGKSYAYTLDNKKCGNNDYNCSQLVWCAYKNTGSKFNLDSNGGIFVAPKDILNSPYTYVIKSF